MDASSAPALALVSAPHPTLGERFDEVALPRPARLAALRLDAVRPPGGGPPPGGALAVFARDLEAPLASRYACVAARVSVPAAGARAVALAPILTDRIVLRGRYGALGGSVHGVDVGGAASDAARAAFETHTAPPLAAFEAPLPASTAAPPEPDAGVPAAAALAAFAACDRDATLPADVVAALTAAADAASLPPPDGTLGSAEPAGGRASRRRKSRRVTPADGAPTEPTERPPGVDADADAAPPGVDADADAAPPGVDTNAVLSPSPSESDREPTPAPPPRPAPPTLDSAALDAVADAIVNALAVAHPLDSDSEPPPRLVAGVAAAAAGARHRPLTRRLLARGALDRLVALLENEGGLPLSLAVHVAAALDDVSTADCAATATLALGGSLTAATEKSNGDAQTTQFDRLVAALAAAAPLPPSVAGPATRAAARVAAAAAAAKFAAAADAAAEAATSSDTKTVKSRLAAVARVAGALADAVAHSGPAPRPRAAARRADPAASARLAVPRAPDGAVVAALPAWRVWSRAAGALRAASAHAASAQLPAGTPPSALAAALAAPLLDSVARLVALALAAPGGGRSLLRDAEGVAALTTALGDGPGEPTAALLRASLVAADAATRLTGADPDAAAGTLVELTATPVGRAAAVAALVDDADAFNAALAAAASPLAPPADGSRRRKRRPGRGTWRGGAQLCGALVAAVARDATRPVAARFAAAAPRIAKALDQAPKGASRAACAVAEAAAAAAAFADAAADGVGSAVADLSAALPPLTEADTDRPGVRTPSAKSVLAFVADGPAVAAATARLTLIAGVCAQRGGARAAAAAAAAGVVDVVESAVRTATTALAAASVDDAWQVAAGDAVDAADAADAAARVAALAFAAAAASATLMSRLKRLGAARGGGRAADALLRLHAQLAVSGDGLTSVVSADAPRGPLPPWSLHAQPPPPL